MLGHYEKVMMNAEPIRTPICRSEDGDIVIIVLPEDQCEEDDCTYILREVNGEPDLCVKCTTFVVHDALKNGDTEEKQAANLSLILLEAEALA